MEVSPPALLFAAVTLEKGSGGIAELSRQVFKALVAMHRKKLIRLEVHVLEGSGPQAEDELFADKAHCETRWYGGNRWKFALSLIRAKSDVQLLDHVGLARLPGLIPLRSGQNFVLLIHGVEIWNSDRADYLRSARKARLLIANSEYTARKVRTRFPDLPDIRVCWPGKDQAEPKPKLKPESGDAALDGIGPHAMLIVGRLSAQQRHKGHDHLIEAMPLILQTIADAQLVIAGAGDDRDRLELKAKQLDVGDKVIFTGWLDEDQLNSLYSQCALFVMPSEGDGFGLVFLEAMMHRLPCVGLKESAAAEIFEDEKSGILVDREDRHGMANKLSNLLLDEPQRKRLGNAGNRSIPGRVPVASVRGETAINPDGLRDLAT